MLAKGERPEVSIIIPAYNEEENVDDVLSRACKAAESSSLSYEVIFVDDGSTDRTKHLALGHNVIILHHEKNMGKGVALKEGFAKARGDIIVTMDADGSHDPKDIPKLILPVLNGSSVALGTRFSSREGRESTTKMNLFGNTLINLSIRLMTGRRVTDSQSGFRAMKRSVVDQIKITTAGFQMETEFLIKALRNGCVMTEVPLDVRKRLNGRTHLKPFRDGIRILGELLRASFCQVTRNA